MLFLRIGILFALLVPAMGQGASTESSSKQPPAAQLGSLQNGAYRNSYFGFSYKLPYGWVDRTEQMRLDSGDPSKSLLLLSAFERPPQAEGDNVNSAVLIAAETVSSYPGLKNAVDYFGPLTEVTTSKGFKVVNEPYAVQVGTKQLVRSDFSREAGKVTMYQASLAMLERGFIVSFTFLGGTEDEIDGLIEGLAFSGTRRTR
ncbi:MAG: hypothetical protein DMG68_14295 [Acidobacteria bacterium]|jgi:hypothetical protein|nr:MAG: hypothetical protein DMG68_14295 [Acidobacteriota bacterium]